jgi:acyl carrier protein
MSLFSRPKAVLWPKSNSVEIFLDKKSENNFSFDINLWKSQTDGDLHALANFLKTNKITSLDLLLPDDVILTKSFIYDSQIDSIETNELIGLAESFVSFKIDPQHISYQLVTSGDKTIIRSQIIDKQKYQILVQNISRLQVTIPFYQSLSSSISLVMSHYNSEEYFFAYPVSETEYSLSLSKGDSLYLCNVLKNSSPDVQKTLNYGNLYFNKKITKFYLPTNSKIDAASFEKMDTATYDPSQIAQKFNKAPNLPLPVLGLFLKPASNSTPAVSPVIINQSTDTNSSPKKMENKKNLLPFIAVFIFTAALASGIIYYVLNRNPESVNSPGTPATSDISPVVDVPVEEPTPTMVEIDKDLELQVLNATDINGQAATLKQLLTKLGFTSIAVGNNSTNLTANEIRVKPELATASAYFTSALAGQFDATISTDLDESSPYDVILLIGTDLSETISDSEEEVTPTEVEEE